MEASLPNSMSNQNPQQQQSLRPPTVLVASSSQQSLNWPNPPALPQMSTSVVGSTSVAPSSHVTQVSHYPISPASSQHLQPQSQPQLLHQQSLSSYPTHVSLLSSTDAAGPLLRSRVTSSSALPPSQYANLTHPPQVIDQQRRQQPRLQAQSVAMQQPTLATAPQRRYVPLPRAATITNILPPQQMQATYQNPQTHVVDSSVLLQQSVPGSFSSLQGSVQSFNSNWQNASTDGLPTRAFSDRSSFQQHTVQPTSQPIPMSPQIIQRQQQKQLMPQSRQPSDRLASTSDSVPASASGSIPSTPKPSTPVAPPQTLVTQQNEGRIQRPEQDIKVAPVSNNNVNETPAGPMDSNESLTASGDQPSGPIQPAEISPSDLLGYLEPHRIVGRGTYGTVSNGFYYGAPVAVKRIQNPNSNPSINSDPAVRQVHTEALHNFVDRIKSMYERVSHGNIVRFYGAFVDEKDLSAVLVTDLMVDNLGDALSELRKKKKALPLSTVLTTARQICSGMIALHAAGCTWDDPKPHNILFNAEVDAEGSLPPHASAAISDFSLSRNVSDCLQSDHATLYQTSQPAGSYVYKAPETFGGDELEEVAAQAADIYSFGLVLYEMLTMRTPWKRMPMRDVHRDLSSGKRPAWPAPEDADYHGPIDEDLRRIVEQTWDANPKSRPTAEGLRQALQAFTDKYDSSSTQRPVSDITRNLVPGDPRASHSQLGTLSKQSSTSTAVVIDGSVELSSTLNGTKESSKIEEESDNDQQSLLQRKGSTMPSLSNPSKLSPLTSPEPRSSKSAGRTVPRKMSDIRGMNVLTQPVLDARAVSQITRKDTSTEETSSSEKLPPTIGVATGTDVEHPDDLSNLRHKEAVQIINQNTSIETHNGNQDHGDHKSAFGDLQKVPSAEFEKHRDEIVLTTAVAAARLSAGDAQHNMSHAYQREVDNDIITDYLRAKPPLYGGTIDGSLPDLNSSTASSMSVRRKRSKRLQNIIEHAALAILEIKRREEANEKTPPRQRREAADRQAAEDTRRAMEKQALEMIDAAKEKDDISTVIAVMRSNRNSYHVARAGTLFLEKYCNHDVLFSDVCEEGGVEELYAGTSLYVDRDEICISFCRSVTALSKQFDDKTNHLIRGIGVPSIVIEVLDKHPTDIEVQIAGCDSLASIAATHELSRLAVATLGGPKCVYNAMTKNNNTFKNIQLARSALFAIQSVAEKNEDAAKYLIDVAALDTVTRATDAFPDAQIETNILETYQAFAFYDKGRSTIVTSSGLKSLSIIMLRNQDPEFLVSCCKFIRSIARWRDDDCENALLESSIAERVIYVLRKSNEIPGEQGARLAWYAAHCCSFLASFGEKSKTRLRHSEAIETLIGILRNRKENPRVVRAATDALGDLINGDPEAKKLAQRCNAITVLDEVHRIHENVSRARNAIRGTLNFLTLPHTVTATGTNTVPKPPNVSADKPPAVPTNNTTTNPPQEYQQPQQPTQPKWRFPGVFRRKK